MTRKDDESELDEFIEAQRANGIELPTHALIRQFLFRRAPDFGVAPYDSAQMDRLRVLLGFAQVLDERKPTSIEIWTPSQTPHPPAAWLRTAPGCVLIAADLLREGRGLHEMTRWRDFEELVAYLLEQDGWTVELTAPSNDGGVDVFAVKSDTELGPIQTIWQAKKYKPTNKVGIERIRELAYVRDQVGASKAFVVTTSFLTSGALTEVQRDEYRLGAMDKPAVEAWVRRQLGEPDDRGWHGGQT